MLLGMPLIETLSLYMSTFHVTLQMTGTSQTKRALNAYTEACKHEGKLEFNSHRERSGIFVGEASFKLILTIPEYSSRAGNIRASNNESNDF